MLSETEECIKFIKKINKFPKLSPHILSIPNEALCHVAEKTRKQFALMGVKKGVPDYFYAEPNEKFHGLFIEMKKQSEMGKPLRLEQALWKENLSSVGYKAVVAYGADAAFREVAKYVMNY